MMKGINCDELVWHCNVLLLFIFLVIISQRIEMFQEGDPEIHTSTS